MADPDIEYLDPELGETTSDVSFGSRPSRQTWGRRRRWIGAGVAMALGGIGVAVALTRHDDATPAAASTPSTTTAPTATTGPRPSTTPATPTYVPPPVFASDPGWKVYVAEIRESQVPRSIDVSTGAVTSVRYDDETSTAIAGSGPLVVPDPLGFSSAVVSVGDGTAWYLQVDASAFPVRDQLVRRSLADGAELERHEIHGIDDAPGLLGTWTDGRPVVELFDHRPYVVATDGTLSRVVDEDVAFGTTDGHSLSNACDPDGTCRTLLRIGSATFVLDAAATEWVAFSPDGSRAATIEFGPSDVLLRIWSNGSGGVGTPRVISEYRSLPYSSSGWSPDSRYFFWIDGETLRVWDTTTNEVYDLAVDLPYQVGIIGVA